MKFLAMGDLHFRATAPRSRVDNYVEVLGKKVEQILWLAENNGCDYILQPGDFFDTATPPYWLVTDVWNQVYDQGWLVVMGQHDQRYHINTLKNTALGFLASTTALTVLKPKPLNFGAEVSVYGCSWGEEIPEIEDSKKRNILVMHRMVIGNEKLWGEQEEYSRAHTLLRKHKFDLIVTGDNHHFFTDSAKGPRWLVNCGSLMRSNIDQIKHKPTVVIYDSRTRDLEAIPLKVAPASKVFDMAAAKQEKARNENLESFVELVGKNKGAPDLDFLATLHQLSHAKGVKKGTVARVNEIVELSDGNS